MAIGRASSPTARSSRTNTIYTAKNTRNKELYHLIGRDMARFVSAHPEMGDAGIYTTTANRDGTEQFVIQPREIRYGDLTPDGDAFDWDLNGCSKGTEFWTE